MARQKSMVIGVTTTPPKFGCTLNVADIGNMQTFDAASGSYEPNYALTPLTINVSVSVTDGDAPLTEIEGRKLLANIRWYEIQPDGSRKQIAVGGANATPGYVKLTDTEGDPNAGQLQVGKNASPEAPINLLFTASVVYGSDTFDIQEAITILCRDSTPSVRCMLTLPQVVAYNPIRDRISLPVSLVVKENGADADPSHYIPVWEVKREDGSWSEYGTEMTDYWLTIAPDKRGAELNQEFMAEGVSVRVRLKYDSYGSPSSVTLAGDDLSVPYARFDVTRDLGQYRIKVVNMPDSLTGFASMSPKLVFSDGRGEIPNPEKYFSIKWLAGPSDRNLSDSDTVGTGAQAKISTSVAKGKPMKVEYKVDEAEPLKAWIDSDGSFITDSDGALLLI